MSIVIKSAVIAVAFGGVVASNIATMLATLFTDAQWSDIQSFLNFIVLVYVALGQNRIAREAPAAAAQQTKDALTDGLHRGGDDDFRQALEEALVDVLASRRRRVDR